MTSNHMQPKWHELRLEYFGVLQAYREAIMTAAFDCYEGLMRT